MQEFTSNGDADSSKLIQTAKILRDPEYHNPKQAGLTKIRITKLVTTANQRFHDALDEIEVEIVSLRDHLAGFSPCLARLHSATARGMMGRFHGVVTADNTSSYELKQSWRGIYD